MATLTTDKERYEFIQSNPSLVAEIPYATVRALARKSMKPSLKT